MADRKSLIPGSLEGLDAPDEIRARISELCEELAQAAGANLRGLILYGGLARGRYRPGKSDINLVVLIKRCVNRIALGNRPCAARSVASGQSRAFHH